jgi:hypothetical protein
LPDSSESEKLSGSSKKPVHAALWVALPLMLSALAAVRLCGISMKGIVPCTPENLLADQNPGDQRAGEEALRYVHAAIVKYQKISGRLPTTDQYRQLYLGRCTDPLLQQVLKREDIHLEDYRFTEHLQEGDIELTPPIAYAPYRDKAGNQRFALSTSIFLRSNAAHCADGFKKYHYSGQFLITDETGAIAKYKEKDMWSDSVNVGLLPIGSKPKWMKTMAEFWKDDSSTSANLRTYDP